MVLCFLWVLSSYNWLILLFVNPEIHNNFCDQIQSGILAKNNRKAVPNQSYENLSPSRQAADSSSEVKELPSCLGMHFFRLPFFIGSFMTIKKKCLFFYFWDGFLHFCSWTPIHFSIYRIKQIQLPFRIFKGRMEKWG